LITGLRDAWEAPRRDEARARLRRLIDTLREKKLPTLADWLEETADQTLACYDLPAGVHRQRLRSTNSVEHDHAEVRRRTRVVRIFPNDASLVRLASALAMERNEKWMERRYFSMPETPPAHVELRQAA
jgi:transposase-like protein